MGDWRAINYHHAAHRTPPPPQTQSKPGPRRRPARRRRRTPAKPTIKLLYGLGIAYPGLARLRHIVHTVYLYNTYTNTVPPRARPGPLRPSSSSGAGLRRPVARQIRLRREGVVAEHHRRCRRSCGGPGARLGGQGRGSSRECSAGASFWVHGTAAGPVREPFRTRSLDGLAGGRYSTTKAPDAAAKDPRTVPGLVVSVGCASRGGEAA